MPPNTVAANATEKIQTGRATVKCSQHSFCPCAGRCRGVQVMEQQDHRVQGPAEEPPPPDADRRLERKPDELHAAEVHDKMTQDLPRRDRGNDLSLLFDDRADPFILAARDDDKRRGRGSDRNRPGTSLPYAHGGREDERGHHDREVVVNT